MLNDPVKTTPSDEQMCYCEKQYSQGFFFPHQIQVNIDHKVAAKHQKNQTKQASQKRRKQIIADQT